MTFVDETEKNDMAKRTPSRGPRRHWWFWMLLAGLAGVGGITYWTHADEPAKNSSARAQQAAPVVAAPARQGDIGIYLTGLGTVTPLYTVTVKSRVDGQLMKVLFQEGQVVKEGALLAEIDSRPYEAALTQAEGQIARDRALLENAKLDLKRYQVLVKQDSIQKQQLDTQESLVHQLEGTVKLDQGQLDNAKVQVVYAHITSPISGRIGLRLVDPGNMIHATDTNGMAVITQEQPIAVVFPIPEDNVPSVVKKLKAGEKLAVEAYDREQQRKLATGNLETIDNQIDPTTGTVRLKAIFPNKDNELFPNQFVNARLLLDTRRGTTIVSTAAVQRSPQGTFVYVVNADMTVTMRKVKLGPSEGDDVSIEEGLSPGERVVLEGAERLRDGSRVQADVPSTESSGKDNK